MDRSWPGSSVHGILQARKLGVGCHFLLQGIFLTQGLKSCLLCILHWQACSLQLVPPGKSLKKAEHQKQCFQIVVLRRALGVPWTSRRSNQSIFKEINPVYSLKGLVLKLQYSGHLMWRDDSFEKTLMLGKIEGKRRRGRQRMRWLDGIIHSMHMSLSKLQEI